MNLQYFRLEPTPLGSERGEQPLSRCGERGVQRERGGSRNTPLTLWPSGATPAAMHLAKGIRPALRDRPLCGKRRFRIASALLWQSQRKNYFLFAFGRVAAPSVCRALERALHPAGRCPNSSSLFPPQAAVVAVARSAERSKRIFTGGAVPVNCIGYRNCILRGVPSPQISGQSTAFCV